MLGAPVCPVFMMILLCCLYIDVKEYLSEFKVLFIIYGELAVSETKCLANNLISQ